MGMNASLHLNNELKVTVKVDQLTESKAHYLTLGDRNNDVNVFMTIDQMKELRDKLTYHIKGYDIVYTENCMNCANRGTMYCALNDTEVSNETVCDQWTEEVEKEEEL